MRDGKPRKEQPFNSERPDQYRSANAKRAAGELVDPSSRLKQIHELSLMLHQPEEDDFSQPGYRKRTDDSDQRQFMRCKLTSDQAQGSFCIGGKRYPCRLIEMSIGGFGILVAGAPRFVPGAIASLRAPNLSYVVSITRLEPREGCSFIGLKQVEEVLDHSVPLPGEPSSHGGYFISVVSGVLIAVLSYYLMAAI